MATWRMTATEHPNKEVLLERLKELDERLVELDRRKNAAAAPENPDAQHEDWGVIAPVTTGEEGLSNIEVMDMGRLLANAPGSILRNLGMMAEAVTSPVQTLKGGYGMVSGGIQAGARAALGGDEASSEDERLFWLVVGEMKKRYGPELRKTLVEDPAGFLLDISGVVSGFGAPARIAGKVSSVARRFGAAGGRMGAAAEKVGDMAGRASSVLRQATPQALAGKVLGKGMKASGGIPETVLPELAGLLSGVDPVAPRLAYQAGKKSRLEHRSFREALKDKSGKIQSMVSEAFDTLGDVRAKRKALYEKLWGALPESKGANPSGVRARVLEFLSEEYNFKINKEKNRDFDRHPDGRIRVYFNGEHGGKESRIVYKEDRRIIEEAITKFLSPREWSKDNMRTVYEQVDAWNRKLNWKESGPAKSALNEIVKAVRKEAHRTIKGAEKVNDEWSRYSDIIDQFETMFHLKDGKKNPASVMRALMGAMRDKGDADIKRSLLAMLEKETDKMILSPAAGTVLSEWLAQGLHGRSIALGVFGGGFYSPALWLAVPFTFPKVVGNFMGFLGAFRRYTVGNIEKFLHTLERVIPAGMATDGLTIGAVIQRSLEAGLPVPEPPQVDIDPRHLRSRPQAMPQEYYRPLPSTKKPPSGQPVPFSQRGPFR